MNLPLFEELGVADEIAHIGIPKYGAELVSPWHDKPSTLDFAQGWDKRFPSAYEVRRSEFDHVLLKNAAANGEADAFRQNGHKPRPQKPMGVESRRVDGTIRIG